MIKTLYDDFKFLSDGGSIWLLSDPHFGDPDCKLMSKDWPTPEEQVKIINSVVMRNDTFVCLGDVGDVSYISDIKAETKVLIKGNHDSGTSNYKRVTRFYDLRDEPKEEIRKLKEEGVINRVLRLKFQDMIVGVFDNRLFDYVYSGPLFISDKILLSHEPIGLPFCLNIHGHDHNQQEPQKEGCFCYNVAANVIDYKPVSLDKIIKSGALSGIKDIHRMTIDKAKERPISKQ